MKRILIADDHRDIAEGIRDALGGDYQIDIATTGLEALTLYRRQRYDGIVLDIDFEAGMTGLEVAARIRQRDQRIPILIFSAVDYSDSVRQRVIDIGATFREKPLDPADIRSILDTSGDEP